MIGFELWISMFFVGLILLLITSLGSGTLDIFDYPIIVFFSLFFLFSGLIGLTGFFSSFSTPSDDLFTFLSGLLLALPVTFFYQRLFTDEGEFDAEKLYLNAVARVDHPVGPGKIGQVYVIDAHGSRVYFPAITLVSETTTFPSRSQVKIVRFEGKTAVVIGPQYTETAATGVDVELQQMEDRFKQWEKSAKHN